eukprot:6429184-Alexandrium_andersonii.AAC.1
MQRCHFALGALGALGKRKHVSGVQSWNCADPGKTSKLVPEAPEGGRSAQFFVQLPNLPMKTAVRGVR